MEEAMVGIPSNPIDDSNTQTVLPDNTGTE